MTSIKICGITREADLALCEELRIDYVGFNFVPSSPRYIAVNRAKALAAGLKRAKAVGIVIGGLGTNLGKIIDGIKLDAVQIYDPTLEELLLIKQHGIALICAFRSVPDINALEAIIASGDSVLLDGAKNGSMANFEEISRLPETIRKHLFLAGGLTVENVAAAIERVHPLAVDVASGIEMSAGIKDYGKMRMFVEAVRDKRNQGNQGNQSNQRT